MCWKGVLPAIYIYIYTSVNPCITCTVHVEPRICEPCAMLPARFAEGCVFPEFLGGSEPVLIVDFRKFETEWASTFFRSAGDPDFSKVARFLSGFCQFFSGFFPDVSSFFRILRFFPDFSGFPGFFRIFGIFGAPGAPHTPRSLPNPSRIPQARREIYV